MSQRTVSTHSGSHADPRAAGRRPAAVQTIEVRPAVLDDVAGIAALVNEQARRGNLLPRSPQSIAASIDDWLVTAASIEGDPSLGDDILGCVSLLSYPSGLVEVRSLAVQDSAQGLGIGRRLMQALIEEARRRRIQTLFALTRVVGFFEQFGFAVTDRHRFPEKVWHDCWQCPLRERCDETAVILELSNFPETASDDAGSR